MLASSQLPTGKKTKVERRTRFFIAGRNKEFQLLHRDWWVPDRICSRARAPKKVSRVNLAGIHSHGYTPFTHISSPNQERKQASIVFFPKMIIGRYETVNSQKLIGEIGR